MKRKKDLSFEEGLARLEDLVASLEDRNIGLDKALNAFEEGLALSEKLREKLNKAAGKVEILVKDLNGQISSRPFNIDGLDSSDDEEDDEDE